MSERDRCEAESAWKVVEDYVQLSSLNPSRPGPSEAIRAICQILLDWRTKERSGASPAPGLPMEEP